MIPLSNICKLYQNSAKIIVENEIENIIGILHAKDLLRALAASPEGARGLEIRSLISPPWFVPKQPPSLNS